MTRKKNNFRLYVVGGIFGAIFGLSISHLILKSAQDDDQPLQFSSQKGFQFGMNTLSFVRSILQLFSK